MVNLKSLFCFVLTGVFASLADAPVQAAPADTGATAPGFYRVEVGSYRLIALFDRISNQSPGILIGGTPEEIAKLRSDAFLFGETTAVSINAFLLNTGENLVLVDTGVTGCSGAKGGMLDNLVASGYKPEDVDTVLITHMHGDHVCGLIDAAGAPVFTNAVVWAAADEAGYWLSAEAKAQAPEGRRGSFDTAAKTLKPYQDKGTFKTFKPGDTLLPNLTVVPTPGHTPGHTSYLFATGGEKLLLWGDITHQQAVQVPRPDISISYDSDPKMAAETRQKLFKEIAAEVTLIAGAHMPFPGLGHLYSGPDGTRWVPVEFGQKF
jgi:glyoxylase-like metal-dependent hydrolase (beta-lactamase superfamily II)